MKVLYTSAQVRNEIVRLFSQSKGRRVAIAAFVGKGAEAVLPNPNGLELFCWPQAGGTNSDAIRRLIKRGAEVRFVDSLHMKVYWTEKGAVITSANLSTNALGSGNLREIGVLISSDQIDIDKVISSLNHRPVSQRELIKLDKASHAYTTGKAVPKNPTRVSSYKQWHDLPHRAQWKLGEWEGSCKRSANAKSRSREEYGVREPYAIITCGSASDYHLGDWVLSFDLSGKSPKTIYWMCIDFVVRTAKTDKGAYSKDCPYQAVQVWPIARYPQPPFKVDAHFKTAFKRAAKAYGLDAIRELSTTKTPAKLAELIYVYS